MCMHLKAKKPGRAIAGFWEIHSVIQELKGIVRRYKLTQNPMLLVYPEKFPETGRSVQKLEKSFEKAIASKLNQLIEQQEFTDCLELLESHEIFGEQAIATLAHLQSAGGAV